MIEPEPHRSVPGAIRPAVWLALIAALAVWAAHRIGGFDLWATVITAEGPARFPNGFAIVDHPFHAVRAETLRRAIADGELLRWIGHHQGGYPVEFYPLGVAWLDLLIWAVALGSLPMMAVHKLTVIVIFLLPAVTFLWYARVDRRSLGVALLAFAAHLSVRGWWWSGGAMELVEWGLVTNVAGATAMSLALPAVLSWTRTGRHRVGGAAALLAAIGLFANPRSGLALLGICAGVAVTCLLADVPMRRFTARLIWLGGLAGLVAAPLLLSLVRFGDLYYFVHYSGYDDFRAYIDSSVQATGGFAFALGLVGIASSLFEPQRLVTRAVAFTAAVYAAMTAFLALSPWPSSLIDQLEPTRLMPFQRLLWLWLAAAGFAFLVERSVRLAPNATRPALRDGVLLLAAASVVLAYAIAPPSFIPRGDRGLIRMPESAQEGIVDLRAAVETADAAAVPGTALLVLGTTLSWHDQLWAPIWSERPFFYDDWLWYWQRDHVGQYDPETEHAYPMDESALDPAYLGTHGIGAVIVTGDARAAAARADWLAPVRAGIWDVYAVRRSVTIVTVDGTAASTSVIDSQRFAFTGEGGEILIRRNWFPRWQAEVDGAAVEINRTSDGYMLIEAGPGPHEIEVRYGTDAWDWLGRLASILGLAAAAWMMIAGDRRHATSTKAIS